MSVILGRSNHVSCFACRDEGPLRSGGLRASTRDGSLLVIMRVFHLYIEERPSASSRTNAPSASVISALVGS
jgi:hypothetical protein